MFFLPYRAKNPPERTPYMTFTLIALNILFYIPTTVYLLYVRESALEMFAVTHNNLSVWRMFTASFLHGGPMHLIGNMLFLWIFGAALEGRLGHLKFILLYFVAALGAWGLNDLMAGALHPNIPSLGASGAIMGLAGAYLYVFPFAPIVCVWLFGGMMTFRGGINDIQARWVVLYFLGWDLLYGLLTRGVGGGVAHFAHLGGAAAGFLTALLLRPRRDSEEYSTAQAMRADVGGHLMALSLPELESLAEATDDPAVVIAFCRKAQQHPSGHGFNMAADALRRHAAMLLDKGDPDEVAQLVMMMPETAAPMPTGWMLRLASKLEIAGSYEWAAEIYRRAATNTAAPQADAEISLLRLANLRERMGETLTAATVYAEMVKRFPNAPSAAKARAALMRLNEDPALANHLVTPNLPSPGGLSAVTPRSAPAPAPAPEPGEAKGNVAGMSLAPIGGGRPADPTTQSGG